MLSPKIQAALNAQINAEYYSSYLYLSMAAYAESLNLKGFANWFRVQAQEEMFHALKFFDYVHQRRGRVELKAVEAPPAQWNSPLAVFEQTLQHEIHVTSLINNLNDLAKAESDYATQALLQWFVTEQVEEEANADAIIQQLKLMQNAPGGLFMLDRELAQRTYVPPAAGEP
jgi:ferritin